MSKTGFFTRILGFFRRKPAAPVVEARRHQPAASANPARAAAKRARKAAHRNRRSG